MTTTTTNSTTAVIVSTTATTARNKTQESLLPSHPYANFATAEYATKWAVASYLQTLLSQLLANRDFTILPLPLHVLEGPAMHTIAARFGNSQITLDTPIARSAYANY